MACLSVGMSSILSLFLLLDMASLWEVLHGRQGRIQSHGTRLQMEDRSLEQEGLRYGDIVFVDVVDTYRNVPSKLLQFYKWYVPSVTGLTSQLHCESRGFPLLAWFLVCYTSNMEMDTL